MALIKCPECQRDVSDAATSCPNCGHPIAKQSLQPPIIYTSQSSTWSPGIAAVLSLVIPGAGQMYKGNIFSGLLWLLFVFIGYGLFVILGLILNIK